MSAMENFPSASQVIVLCGTRGPGVYQEGLQRYFFSSINEFNRQHGYMVTMQWFWGQDTLKTFIQLTSMS
jgi:hypothetical protein